MKKIIFALMGLAMLSCETSIFNSVFTEPDGKQSDTIKTSVDIVTVTADSPSVEITTEGKHWFMESFEVDGEVYNVNNYLDFSEDSSEWTDKTVELSNGYTFKIGAVEGLADDWKYLTEISCDWVTITRTLQKITIKATDIKVDVPKTIKVWLWDRNYSERITITRE